MTSGTWVLQHVLFLFEGQKQVCKCLSSIQMCTLKRPAFEYFTVLIIYVVKKILSREVKQVWALQDPSNCGMFWSAEKSESIWCLTSMICALVGKEDLLSRIVCIALLHQYVSDIVHNSSIWKQKFKMLKVYLFHETNIKISYHLFKTSWLFS